MRSVSRVSGGLDGSEALALKRQCVTHGKPFFATAATDPAWHEVDGKTVALIAGDAHKPRMVAFAAQHVDLPSKFAHRAGTGTTGGLLNDMAWSRGSTRPTSSCSSAPWAAQPTRPPASTRRPWPSAGPGPWHWRTEFLRACRLQAQ